MKFRYCICCEKETRHNVKMRLNGKTMKFPMCESCQLNTAVELIDTMQQVQNKKALVD